jgi:cytochrome P450
MNLAWAEMYIALATMIRHFDLTIDGTTAEDMQWIQFTLPIPGICLLRALQPPFRPEHKRIRTPHFRALMHNWITGWLRLVGGRACALG